MVVVWQIAFGIAHFLGMDRADYRLPGCVGGLVGALGLVLCVSIGERSLFSVKHFIIGALVGSFSGLSFASWTQLDYATDLNRGPMAGPPTPMNAFAIWQAAVGTYLYWISLHAKQSIVVETVRTDLPMPPRTPKS
jgi:hypothetical protein